MTQELEQIWDTAYFKNGQKYFWLYNYDLFRIVEKTEFQNLNSKTIHKNKSIFAVADATSGDNEHRAYLYFDNLNGDIYIQSNLKWVEPIELRNISTGLGKLLGKDEYSDVLIEKHDTSFWGWQETVYQSYEISPSVPKGVLPDIDLRFFFNKMPGTFLIDHKEVSLEKLEEYFNNFSLTDLDLENIFRSRPSNKELIQFISKVNTIKDCEMFYLVLFNPSAFVGFGNLQLLSSEQKQLLNSYGLLNY